MNAHQSETRFCRYHAESTFMGDDYDLPIDFLLGEEKWVNQ